jgi:hypothetical protein
MTQEVTTPTNGRGSARLAVASEPSQTRRFGQVAFETDEVACAWGVAIIRDVERFVRRRRNRRHR